MDDGKGVPELARKSEEGCRHPLILLMIVGRGEQGIDSEL